MGLVWIAIPDWMRSAGIDIRLVGITTLAQAPWAFKLLWAPMMSRWEPAFRGRLRSWMIVAQAGLIVATAGLGLLADAPNLPWVILAVTMAVAFAASSQDIALDAYAVEVLREGEHGIVVGARTGFYRAAMFVSGGMTIFLASHISWQWVCLLQALLYLPMILLTWRAPALPDRSEATRPNLRREMWEPFVGMMSRPRAIEILAFVLLYKLADALSQSLLRPFLIDMGYDNWDRGVGLTTVGLLCTVGGTFLGGIASVRIGLGRALWLFGALQIVSNVGYLWIAQIPTTRWAMYSAMSFEMITSGMGMGAFGVLLLRLTAKRFSTTQYALFSSMFALPRVVGGPITGFVVHQLGWTSFFVFTMVAGVPGMILLARFVPWGQREIEVDVESDGLRGTVDRKAAWRRGSGGGIVGMALALLLVGLGDALTTLQERPEAGFDLGRSLGLLLRPEGSGGWILLAGLVVFSLICGILGAASGIRRGQKNNT